MIGDLAIFTPDLITYALIITCVVTPIIALIPKDLLKAVIIGTGIEGLALAILFQRLLAPDVAITQAILGSALVAFVFFITVVKTRRYEE